MHYAIILGIAVALGGWVLSPLLTSRPQSPPTLTTKKNTSQRRRKSASRTAPSHSAAHPLLPATAKKVSSPPESVRRIDDVAIMEELERIRLITDIDAAIEGEIRQIRTLPVFQQHQRSTTLRAIHVAFCPQCGASLESPTLFCTHCDIDVGRYVQENA